MQHLFLTQPLLCVALAMVGILLIYWEANRPGTVVPGCAGLLLLLLGVHLIGSFQIRPLFVCLGILGFLLAVADAWIPRHGTLTTLGICLSAVGIQRLFVHPEDSVPVVLSIGLAAAFNIVTSYLATVALKARRAKRSMRLERDTLNAVFRP